MKFYPSIPADAGPDFFEQMEIPEQVDDGCTCSPIDSMACPACTIDAGLRHKGQIPFGKDLYYDNYKIRSTL